MPRLRATSRAKGQSLAGNRSTNRPEHGQCCCCRMTKATITRVRIATLVPPMSHEETASLTGGPAKAPEPVRSGLGGGVGLRLVVDALIRAAINAAVYVRHMPTRLEGAAQMASGMSCGPHELSLPECCPTSLETRLRSLR